MDGLPGRPGLASDDRFASLTEDLDYIHPESLASDEVWQALLDLASDNVVPKLGSVNFTNLTFMVA